MPDYRSLEQQFSRVLGLERRPVAISFLDRPPAGVAQFTGSEPSGCSFWRLAQEGRAFYTQPADHYNCAVGCYTHNIPLPPDRAKEMDETLAFMMRVGYISAEDLPHIARLAQTPQVTVYAPLGATPVAPGVVLFAGRPGRVMLLHEAALRAGVGTQSPNFGRPTCMALPAAQERGVVASTGCVGNRVYTGLGEDELYVAVRGADLEKVAAHLDIIATANAELAEYHQGRRQQLASE